MASSKVEAKPVLHAKTPVPEKGAVSRTRDKSSTGSYARQLSVEANCKIEKSENNSSVNKSTTEEQKTPHKRVLERAKSDGKLLAVTKSKVSPDKRPQSAKVGETASSRSELSRSSSLHRGGTDRVKSAPVKGIIKKEKTSASLLKSTTGKSPVLKSSSRENASTTRALSSQDAAIKGLAHLPLIRSKSDKSFLSKTISLNKSSDALDKDLKLAEKFPNGKGHDRNAKSAKPVPSECKSPDGIEPSNSVAVCSRKAIESKFKTVVSDSTKAVISKQKSAIQEGRKSVEGKSAKPLKGSDTKKSADLKDKPEVVDATNGTNEKVTTNNSTKVAIENRTEISSDNADVSQQKVSCKQFFENAEVKTSTKNQVKSEEKIKNETSSSEVIPVSDSSCPVESLQNGQTNENCQGDSVQNDNKVQEVNPVTDSGDTNVQQTSSPRTSSDKMLDFQNQSKLSSSAEATSANQKTLALCPTSPVKSSAVSSLKSTGLHSPSPSSASSDSSLFVTQKQIRFTGSKTLQKVDKSQSASFPDQQDLYHSSEPYSLLDFDKLLASYKENLQSARSETEVQTEKSWMESERMWLVHKGGFASAALLKSDGTLPEGRVKIRLDHGGEIIDVDEDDIEKANPPQLDRAEDLALLRYLNESSCLHTLRQRYGSNLIHTYAGPSLIIINSMQPLQIYSEKVIQMFKGCKQEDMPPHIFAMGQIAYRDMLSTRHDQSIVFMGRSGSGKTANMHHALHYLTAAGGSINNILTVDKLNAMLTLLEAFGNSRTILNTNASRFAQLTTLDYDYTGQIVSASVQVLLFEKTRVFRRPEGEPTFHVFYQLLAGVDSALRNELQLTSLNEPNHFMTPLQKAEDRQKAVQFWSKIYSSMEVIGMTEDEVKAVCSVLAAIYHLGVAGAAKGNNNKGQFARPAAAHKVATLLGISVEELARTIFSASTSATLTRSASVRGSPADKGGGENTTAMEALEGFAIGLYSDVFNAIVSLINRSLSSNIRSLASITVVDSPGFQNPSTCGRQSGASFDDLCYNYAQEKLQLFYHDLTFTVQQDRYSQEHIECDFEFVTTSPAAIVSLIEKPSQQSLRSVRTSTFIENLIEMEKKHASQSNSDEKHHATSETENVGSPSHETIERESETLLKNLRKKPLELRSYSHILGDSTHRPSSPQPDHSGKIFHHQQGGHHGHHQSQGHTPPHSPGYQDDHSQEVRTSNPEAKDAEKKGLLWILDEEAIFPGATEDSFMDRFFNHHGEQKVRRDSLLRKASSIGNTFILNHFQGTNPVQYNASGWLKVCRENPVSKIATQVLQDSKKSNIRDLFNSVKAPVGGMVSGSIVGMEGSNSLRRVGSMRRTFMSGTAGLKKKSMCILVKYQVDSIIETLRKTQCHFVHCILPQLNAGLSDLKTQQEKASAQEDILMNVPLVRSQLRGSEIMESVRIHRQGFPEYLSFVEFRQKFEKLISPSSKPGQDVDEKQAVMQILENLDLDKVNYKIGLSQVFFKAGVLNRLESSRDEKISEIIVSFQACCRGYLARRNIDKHRLRHMAISCIQKNVRKFVQIRDWPWWKLYTKVKPLLNVHRTEEELKAREIELEQIKTRAEKLEKERNEFKQQCDKLENRLAEIQADLAEENTTATQATEILEQEQAERMRLEKELKDIQGKYNSVRRNHEKLEMEVIQLKLWQAETLDGELEEDDVDGGIYKDRYERLLKEMEFNKKKQSQQHEEEMEQEQQSKKAIEKRLHEALEDAEEQHRQLLAAKKKVTKLMSEMQDSKHHLEEQMARNNDLERKQRRFDAELSKANDEAKQERTQREKLQRDRDESLSEKFTLDQDLQKVRLELEAMTEKCNRLEKEVTDMSLSGTKDDHEVLTLKRAKNELEAKTKDQEEELDDQAASIQQLEQTKLRLEMNYEKLKQQHMKELEEKEEEMEEMRFSTQKKLKQAESQLEEEYEEKKVLQQKNRDMERQLQEVNNQASFRDKDTEKRLRRDLKKTKALLKDAELMLQKQKSGEGTKATVRQLRNQLDDAEFASAAATKARKTMELELQDLQQQLEELFTAKQETENKCMTLMREKTDLQTQLEENEEDLADIMKKYKAVVQQQSVDQIKLTDQLGQIEELIRERDQLKQEVNDLTTRITSFEESTVDKQVVARLEIRIRELETKLEFETTSRHRLELQVTRTKEQVDKVTEEKEQLTVAKQHAEEMVKKTQRHLRDLREEFSDVQKREMETSHKSKELENKVAELESDFEQNQSDLKLAFKRIADLQAALEEDVDSDISLGSDSEDFDVDGDDDDDTDIDTFLQNHKQKPVMRQNSNGSSTTSRSVSTASSTQDALSGAKLAANTVDASEA